MLRRPPAHCRGLWARWRTARARPPAPRAGFEAMAIPVVLLQQPTAGTSCSRRCARFSLASASAGTTSLISPQSGPRPRWQGPVRNHQLLSLSPTCAKPPPPTPLPTFPIAGQLLATVPRVRFSEAFGRRTSALARVDCSPRAGIRNPNRKRTITIEVTRRCSRA